MALANPLPRAEPGAAAGTIDTMIGLSEEIISDTRDIDAVCTLLMLLTRHELSTHRIKLESEVVRGFRDGE